MTAYTTETVTSKDGSTIVYRQLGAGPGIVLVHGGMNAAQNLMKLALALSDAFTLYVPDRRGRGRSSPYGDDYGLARECEDIEALLAETGARRLFGLSSGGIIGLHAALAQPNIRKLAVYEPPLSTNHSSPTGWISRFDLQVAAGNLSAALVTALKGARMSPLLDLAPSWLLAPVFDLATKLDKKPLPEGDIPIRELIPTMHFDIQLVMETENTTESLGAIAAEVMLLGGSKSPGYLRDALDRLKAALPRAERVELRGLDHLGPENDGAPKLVAAELRRFFL